MIRRLTLRFDWTFQLKPYKLTEFEKMFQTALIEQDDVTITDLFEDIEISILFRINNRTTFLPITNNYRLIAAEYFKRLEKLDEQEEQARQELQKERERILKERLYPDSTKIADEDRYATYTVQQFQDEIDWLRRTAVSAWLDGDKEREIALAKQANEMTARQQELEQKIQDILKIVKGVTI